MLQKEKLLSDSIDNVMDLINHLKNQCRKITDQDVLAAIEKEIRQNEFAIELILDGTILH